ncbi:protein of unknown function DUF74 [Caldalkalibacillus thermarum TA2.A1]|uniref:YbjQ family protein n=1 Tax=Caldalkalibacillus thermarum (strain TA2.A1) TaxID=986075 RepID=F5L7W6_CALTT|nr:heavy metal-binding domain-containing protein [Caldalkalibacillus thermarum]EGL82554.1 protein of unknown function DUF74 [Caldalkalibacillus thermarum TA2.A1]QZT34793.1 YbjQ family protein [Caldalkalibacillus thermarum TA2.A1]
MLIVTTDIVPNRQIKAKGDNAIVGVRLHSSTVMSGASMSRASKIIAYGTAVVIE